MAKTAGYLGLPRLARRVQDVPSISCSMANCRYWPTSLSFGSAGQAPTGTYGGVQQSAPEVGGGVPTTPDAIRSYLQVLDGNVGETRLL